MKVISRVNMVAGLPVNSTLIGCLLLDRFHATIWVWCLYGVAQLFIWAVALLQWHKEEPVDVIETIAVLGSRLTKLEITERKSCSSRAGRKKVLLHH